MSHCVGEVHDASTHCSALIIHRRASKIYVRIIRRAEQ
jgi:hypothetical protein